MSKLTIKRFNTISIFGNMAIEDYKEPEQAATPYIVDTSGFIPMSEAVKKVTGRTGTAGDILHRYDYLDGKGSPADRIPVDRTHRFTGDIAEVSVAMRDAAQRVNNDMSNAVDAYKDWKNAQDYAASVADINAQVNNASK